MGLTSVPDQSGDTASHEPRCAICDAPADETIVYVPSGAHERIRHRVDVCNSHCASHCRILRYSSALVIGITDSEAV